MLIMQAKYLEERSYISVHHCPDRRSISLRNLCATMVPRSLSTVAELLAELNRVRSESKVFSVCLEEGLAPRLREVENALRLQISR